MRRTGNEPLQSLFCPYEAVAASRQRLPQLLPVLPILPPMRGRAEKCSKIKRKLRSIMDVNAEKRVAAVARGDPLWYNMDS